MYHDNLWRWYITSEIRFIMFKPPTKACLAIPKHLPLLPKQGRYWDPFQGHCSLQTLKEIDIFFLIPLNSTFCIIFCVKVKFDILFKENVLKTSYLSWEAKIVYFCFVRLFLIIVEKINFLK